MGVLNSLFQERETGLAAPSLRRSRRPLTIIDRCFLSVAAVFGLCALVGLVELLSGWTLPAPSAWQDHARSATNESLTVFQSDGGECSFSFSR